MMAGTVLFNVGGQQYRISQSLLDTQPKCMPTRSASEHWHSDDSSEIYIDRNGSRFQYVLDYLRDGRVVLPISECKEAIISELEYYSIDYDEDYIIHSSTSQSQAVDGMKIIQNTIMKWRCADLAADCMEAAWKEGKWRNGDKQYLSFEPNRFKEICHNMKEKEVIMMTNEYLMSLGVKISSMDFDIGHERCRVTLQVTNEE